MGTPVLLDPLRNDSDPLRNGLELVAFTQPLRGSLQQQGNHLLYTPRAGFSGWDRFSYTIRNHQGFEDSAFVRIDIPQDPDFVISLNGEDDHIEFAAQSNFNLQAPVRIESWFYARGYGEFDTGFGRIMDKDKILLFLVGYEHGFYNDESLIFFLRLSNGRQAAANTPRGSIQLNRWHHVIAEYVPARSLNDRVRIWIDGNAVPVSFPSDVGPRPEGFLANNSSDALFIGESEALTRAFDGDIAALHISTGANVVSPVFTPWLQVDFNEGQGTQIFGTGNASRTGTLRGAFGAAESIPKRWPPAPCQTALFTMMAGGSTKPSVRFTRTPGRGYSCQDWAGSIPCASLTIFGFLILRVNRAGATRTLKSGLCYGATINGLSNNPSSHYCDFRPATVCIRANRKDPTQSWRHAISAVFLSVCHG
ncbi:MAG: Ig-like domain-containing protein [Verrucomicrobia bacterium]|nr:Ig-like domain-containing protein [Verrucomicrobiota bacterium]